LTAALRPVLDAGGRSDHPPVGLLPVAQQLRHRFWPAQEGARDPSGERLAQVGDGVTPAADADRLDQLIAHAAAGRLEGAHLDWREVPIDDPPVAAVLGQFMPLGTEMCPETLLLNVSWLLSTVRTSGLP